VELGYDGYPSMQKALQEMVVNRLTATQRIEVTNDRIGDKNILSMVLQSDMEKLRQTGETVDKDAFEAAVNAVLGAERVYIIGVRSAAPLANFLGYYLNYMFQNVHVLTTSGAGEMFEQIAGVNDTMRDLFLELSNIIALREFKGKQTIIDDNFNIKSADLGKFKESLEEIRRFVLFV
jgi:DNA-binding MurR/RpiR family transcriptional regulator